MSLRNLAEFSAYTVAWFLLFSVSASLAAEFAIKKTEQGAAVTIDGQLFAEYLIKSGHQPVIWPIIGPGNQPMTRQHPLGPPLATEKKDHPHHRSLWFSHGQVNGLDFWMEPKPVGPVTQNNQIEHRDFVALGSGGPTAKLIARNNWTSDGKKICQDVRTIEFGADEHGRWIDFAIELFASDSDLTFGDTEEGSLGIRVAGTMDVNAKKGGQILNSHGQTDVGAWGHSAEWVDYSGSIRGEPAGIAVFNLPDSFRYPNRWHVRPYGLFAANPFGQTGFPPEGTQQGAVTLAKGEKLRLHYRLLFYQGQLSPKQLNAINTVYASSVSVQNSTSSSEKKLP